MIEECMAGRIYMIITKSISRFARNTLDCLKYIWELKENNNTMDSKKDKTVPRLIQNKDLESAETACFQVFFLLRILCCLRS